MVPYTIVGNADELVKVKIDDKLLTPPEISADLVDTGVTIVGGGGLLYGIVFLMLGFVPTSLLWVAMLLAGIASAAIYAPSLCFAATLAPRGARATSMALLNAGGSLGMMVGTATGGILSSVLLSSGWLAQDAYPAIFQLAGAAQIGCLVLLWRSLTTLGRQEERVPMKAANCPAL